MTTVLSGIVGESTPWPEGKLFHSDLGLYGFQGDGVARAYWQLVESNDPVLDVLWQTGLGKQSSVSEPVLTPLGWKVMGDLRVGDQVFSADGRPASVLGVYPQVDRTNFRVTFSDGSWTRCGPEHLWTVTRWRQPRVDGKRTLLRHTETVTLSELLRRGIKTLRGRRKFAIPMTLPVQYPETVLPIEPYALGVILGDGHIMPDGQARLSTDREIIETWSGTGAPIHEAKGCWNWASARWKTELLALDLAGTRSWEKFVPRQYLHASEDQRRALLAGLLDTDGYPIPEGGVEFSTTSEDLADAVQELAESLGGTGIKSASRVTRYPYEGEMREGRPSWRVNVKLNQQPFRLERKAALWVEPTKYPASRWIESVERLADEDQVCIRIDRPDGLYLTRSHIVTHNTILVLATHSLMVEDGVVDQVIVVAEANKVTDWVSDYGRFTRISAGLYAGTPAKRAKILANPPQVLVMTYETGRNDICVFRAKSKAVTGSKMLTEFLRGKRVLIVFDEVSRLRSRNTLLYVAWNYLINRTLRREPTGRTMVMGLTATKVENNPEDHFNANLLLAPWLSQSVAEFQRDHIASWDFFGNPVAYKNLSPAKCESGVVPLSERFAAITLKKRKADPDVIGFFPAKVENPPRYIELSSRHREFYDAVQDLFSDSPEEMMTTFGLLRQIAADPTSLLRSQGQLATQIVDTIGSQALHQMGSAKVDEMLAWAEELGGDQGVIFTFYGQSVLPILAEHLTRVGYRLSSNHGQMSVRDRETSQGSFKAGDTQIFLSSDAGARGLNLGCGSALLHYELPLLYSTFVQRSDRIHRIDSVHESVTVDALVARGTVEEAISALLLKRNDWSDKVLGDDTLTEGADPGEMFMTASMRRDLWRQSQTIFTG